MDVGLLSQISSVYYWFIVRYTSTHIYWLVLNWLLVCFGATVLNITYYIYNIYRYGFISLIFLYVTDINLR